MMLGLPVSTMLLAYVVDRFRQIQVETACFCANEPGGLMSRPNSRSVSRSWIRAIATLGRSVRLRQSCPRHAARNIRTKSLKMRNSAPLVTFTLTMCRHRLVLSARQFWKPLAAAPRSTCRPGCVPAAPAALGHAGANPRAQRPRSRDRLSHLFALRGFADGLASVAPQYRAQRAVPAGHCRCE